MITSGLGLGRVQRRTRECWARNLESRAGEVMACLSARNAAWCSGSSSLSRTPVDSIDIDTLIITCRRRMHCDVTALPPRLLPPPPPRPWAGSPFPWENPARRGCCRRLVLFFSLLRFCFLGCHELQPPRRQPPLFRPCGRRTGGRRSKGAVAPHRQPPPTLCSAPLLAMQSARSCEKQTARNP